jgi:hypothetical protein
MAGSPLRLRARAESGPYRAITLDVNVELDVVGYLAPAALALAGRASPSFPNVPT